MCFFIDDILNNFLQGHLFNLKGFTNLITINKQKTKLHENIKLYEIDQTTNQVNTLNSYDFQLVQVSIEF